MNSNQVDNQSAESVGAKLEPKEQTTYKCEECYEIYEEYYRALECIFTHARGNLATAMLNAGRTLSSIQYICGFNWELADNQKDITKDNCFVMSHWQLCEKPAYSIYTIDGDGTITIGGWGGWHGPYSDKVKLSSLTDPRPASEKYSYAETKARRGF